MMPIQALLPDRKLILGAARLKSRYPISYADAFAVETAREQNAILVTGDPELRQLSKQELIEHCCAVGDVTSLFGFYLQLGLGGRVLEFEFWRRFLELGNVVAIKVVPFNRYQTLAVIRALVGRGGCQGVADCRPRRWQQYART